jgi:hypothetical protein
VSGRPIPRLVPLWTSGLRRRQAKRPGRANTDSQQVTLAPPPILRERDRVHLAAVAANLAVDPAAMHEVHAHPPSRRRRSAFALADSREGTGTTSEGVRSAGMVIAATIHGRLQPVNH